MSTIEATQRAAFLLQQLEWAQTGAEQPVPPGALWRELGPAAEGKGVPGEGRTAWSWHRGRPGSVPAPPSRGGSSVSLSSDINMGCLPCGACYEHLGGQPGLEGLGVHSRSTHKCISTQAPESSRGSRPTARELTTGTCRTHAETHRPAPAAVGRDHTQHD